MDDVFAPGGALERALPEYEPRREQAALAAAVEHALATGEHLVAEAGTGVGKSLAYLVPALESGLRVVVATATKALQEQLLSKDVPIAAAAVGRKVNVQVLKGRANYLCRRQLQGFQPFLMAEGRDARAWEAMSGWLDTTETGDRAELELEPSDALWAEIAVGPDRCSGRRCPFVSACFSEAARERAAGADLVIVNHALYFAHLASGGGVLPEHDAVIFDEGHRLEESAASWLGGRVSRAGLRRLTADIERACRESQRPYPARQAERVERSGERLLRAVAPPSGRKRLREVPAEPAAHEPRVLTRRQRGRDEDRRRPVVPQQLAQLAGDVDRRPRDGVGLRPDDTLRSLRLEARRHLACHSKGAPGQRIEILALSLQHV